MDWSWLTSAGTSHISELETATRLLLAVGLGAVIGFEREFRDRPAGLKTHILTSLAAAVFTVITFELFHWVRTIEQVPNADPIRVIQAVTAGVAFLAAGTIIQSRGRVRGLTTGAGMWLAGAVGVACGAGYYSIGVMAAALAVLVFTLVNRLEKHVLKTRSALKDRAGRSDLQD